jgi:hypothetical protein
MNVMDEMAKFARSLDDFLEEDNDGDKEVMNSEGDGLEPELDVGDEVMRLLNSEGEGLEPEQLPEAVPAVTSSVVDDFDELWALL